MKISVAICTYNGEKYLREQIDSILQQTRKVDEIVVCDDRSSDKTMAILEEYAEANPNLFRLFINEVNLRSVKNFEKAISLCSGDIIFLSDQDDKWVEEKVAEYIDYFEKNPTMKAIASNGYCINDDSEIEDKYAIWEVPQFLAEKGISYDYYSIINYVSNLATGASMAFKKEIVDAILPFPIVKNFHHDEWIAIVATQSNAFELLNKKYFYYRTHDSQQVGGVFYDKTDYQKTKLTETFDIHNQNTSFVNYKIKLKKYIVSYQKNVSLIQSGTKHNPFLKENLVVIEGLFEQTKKQMKAQYPFLSFLLNISDKITNKRQLK
ncbi:MAG: glycosyltransferase family 2 protein [Flavobacterium sp.]